MPSLVLIDIHSYIYRNFEFSFVIGYCKGVPKREKKVVPYGGCLEMD